MSETATSAPIHGPRWGARAGVWAEFTAGLSMPAWEAVAEATGIAEGTRLLDLGCGSGEFCWLAAERGAAVSGIDAAEGMIEIARRRVPHGDLRVGAMEHLPWQDHRFEVVTGFNAVQFAADTVAALSEARRVTRPGGQVAICNWGRPEDNGMFAIMARCVSCCRLLPRARRRPTPRQSVSRAYSRIWLAGPASTPCGPTR